MFNHCDNHTNKKTARHKNEYHHNTDNMHHGFHRNSFTANHHSAIYQFDNFTTSKHVKNYEETPKVGNQDIHVWYIKK